MKEAPSIEPRRLIDYLGLATDFLAARSIEGARLDAELLLAEVLDTGRVELYTSYSRELGASEVARYRQLLQRRASREPLAYIIGRREFFSLDFAVDRRVLIPRPETELLVELAIDRLESIGESGRTDMLEIGTGSGAVAVAIAVKVGWARILATDLCEATLEVAPDNARRHGVDGRVEFAAGDLFDGANGQGPFSLVVSNPPYIKTGEIASLAPEVAHWEPRRALLGGSEGMSVSAPLVSAAADYLVPEGWLLVEVGTQAAQVRQLFESQGWREVACHRDLAGRDRVVAGKRPA
ncbi:MAG: peptide chain release factor N(5)-glutamine methyltransferase [Deltaproteobacteria bacterium]